MKMTIHKISYLIILLGCWTSMAQADDQAEELAKKSTQLGSVRVITSKSSDPIGVADLWGLRGNFIVDHSCQQSYAALANVEKYPQHSKNVKKVTVLKKTENTLLVDYTEGGFGWKSTTKLLWTFTPNTPTPSIVSASVQEKSPSWLELQFHDAGHPNYCDIHLQMFADISFVPKFVMNWMSTTAAKELVATYRKIIKGTNTSKN